MTERNPAVVAVLSVVTFGLYGLYWLYKTTEELKEETGDPALNPGMDLALTIISLGLWGVFATHRNARIAHKRLHSAAQPHEDKSILVLLFCALSYVMGFAWILAAAILQEDFNGIARRSRPLIPAPPVDQADSLVTPA